MTREEAIEFVKEQLEIFGKDSAMYKFLAFSTKAIERPKAHWIELHSGFRCSRCYKFTTSINDKNYCSKCGAVMRGDL